MDFNLILLVAGLGLLFLIILCALWGFLGGLKRELRCIAVLLVLLVLAWLIFGDPKMILNMKGSLVTTISGMLNVTPQAGSSLWDVILVFGQGIIPNGAEILVEGTETYTLFFEVVSGLLRFVGLASATIATFVIALIVRLITYIVELIIRSNRKKKKAAEPATQEVAETSKQADSSVLISEGKGGMADSVVSIKKQDVPERIKGKQRWWGALASSLKGAFVVVLLMAPISGICSVLSEISPASRAAISDAIEGSGENRNQGNQQMATSNSNGFSMDVIWNFVDSYESSALGKTIDCSKYFFKKSFSQMFFNSALKIETKNDNIVVSDELKVFIDAINKLEGNFDYKNLTTAQLNGALDALKSSKLLVEVFPVAIEVADSIDKVESVLVESDSENDFLRLRYNDWATDLPIILDAVKYCYQLNLFDKDFNYLTMDPTILKQITNLLTDTTFVNQVLPIAIQAGVHLPQVEELVGKLEKNPDVTGIEWKKELATLVDCYQSFQELGITSLSGFDFKAFLKEQLATDESVDKLVKVLNKATDLKLLNQVVLPLGVQFGLKNDAISKQLEAANQIDTFKQLKTIDLSGDLKKCLNVAKELLKLVDVESILNGTSITDAIDLFKLDESTLRKVANALGTTTFLPKLATIGANVGLLSTSKIGITVNDLDLSNYDWVVELNKIVDIYVEFKKLGFTSIKDIQDLTGSKEVALPLINDLFNDETKYAALQNIVNYLAETQTFSGNAGKILANYLENFLKSKDMQISDFGQGVDFTAITSEEWKEDLNAVLDSAKLAVGINAFEMIFSNGNIANVDISSAKATSSMKAIVSHLLTLNLLGNDETKSTYALAGLTVFGFLTKDNLIDLSNVIWDNEVTTINSIIDLYLQMTGCEGFDVLHLGDNYEALLENDVFLDLVVDALDRLVDSNLTLDLLPTIIDKYVLPKLDEVDDDNIGKDIIDNLTSEEMIKEVSKLIDAVKAAVRLGVLKFASSKDIRSIDLKNTEDMQLIVETIFDSKFIKNHEGKIIRIILRLTNLLQLERGALEGIDYSNEKEILVSFIQQLSPVLKSEDLTLIDENGQFYFDKEFFANNDNSNMVIGALETLLGKYQDETTKGSNLVPALLPEILKEYVTLDKFPIDTLEGQVALLLFIELNPYEMTGEALADDITSIVYIAKQAVAMGGLKYLADENVDLYEDIDELNLIIDAFSGLNVIQGHSEYVFAVLVGYISAKFGIEFSVDPTEMKVDWAKDKDNIKKVLNDIIILLHDNKLSKVKAIKALITSIKYTNSNNDIESLKGIIAQYITNANVTRLLDIVDEAVKIECLDSVIIVAAQLGIYYLNEYGINLSELLGYVDDKELIDDVHTILDTLKMVVNETEILNYYHHNFSEPDAIPSEEVILKIVDNIWNLNLIQGNQAYIVNRVLKFVLYNSKILSAEELYPTLVDYDKEYEVLKQLISWAYKVLVTNNLTNVQQIYRLINDTWYTNYVDFINDGNGYLISELLPILANSQFVKNASTQLLSYGVEKLASTVDLSFLKDVTSDELMEDIRTLSPIIKKAVDFGVMDVITVQRLNSIDTNLLGDIVEDLQGLNLVSKHFDKLLSAGCKVGFEKISLLKDFSVTDSDFAGVEASKELGLLAECIRDLGPILSHSNLISLTDVLLFVENKDFLNGAFLDETNTNALIGIAEKLLQSKIIIPLATQLVSLGIDILNNAGYDISFVEGKLTSQQVIDDLYTLLYMARRAVDFGVLDMIFYQKSKEFEALPLTDIVGKLEELNIYTLCRNGWIDFAIKLLNEKKNLGLEVTSADFASVNWENDNKLLQQSIELIVEFTRVSSLDTYERVLEFVKNKEYNDRSFYVENRATAALDVVDSLANIQFVGVLLPTALTKGVDLAVSKGLDISFVKESASDSALLASDIHTIVRMARSAINYGVIDFVQWGDMSIYKKEDLLAIVKELRNLNLLTSCEKEWMSFATNYVLKLAKLTNVVVATPSMFESVDFAKDNVLLQSVVSQVIELLVTSDLSTYSSIKSFIDNKGYNDKEFFNQYKVNRMLHIVDTAIDINTLNVLSTEFFNWGIDLVISKYQATIDFVKEENLTDAELVSDVHTLVRMGLSAVSAGVVDYYQTSDMELTSDTVVYINEIIAEINSLNIITKGMNDWMVYATNFVSKNFLKYYVYATEDTYEGVDWTAENANFQLIVTKLVQTINSIEYNSSSVDSIKELLAFVQDSQALANLNTYTETVAFNALGALDSIGDMQVVSANAKGLIKYGVKFAKDKGYDLTFIKDENLTGAELCQDIHKLVKIGRFAISFGALELAQTGNIGEMNFAALDSLVASIQKLNIVSKDNAGFATFIANLGVTKFFKDDKVYTVEDYQGIDWALENQLLRDAISEIHQGLLIRGITSLNGTIDYFKSSLTKEKISSELLSWVADILEPIANIKSIQVGYPVLARYGMKIATEKGYEVSFVLDGLTDEQISVALSQDLLSLVEVLRDAATFEVVEFVFQDGSLNYDEWAKLNDLVDRVLSLKILAHDDAQNKLIVYAMEKFGNIDTTGVDMSEVNWKQIRGGRKTENEIASIQSLLSEAKTFLQRHNLNTLQEIKSFDYKSLVKVDATTNLDLTSIANILDILADDALVSAVEFAVSKKFFSDPSIVRLAGLHEIYTSSDEVTYDLHSLANAIQAVINLDVNSWLNEKALYPFDKAKDLCDIVNNILGLFYFNNENRIHTLLSMITVEGTNLGDLNTKNINLKIDAAKLCEMILDLTYIAQDSGFPIKSSEDLNQITISFSWLFSANIINKLLDAIQSLMETTTYKETDGAILLCVIPVLKGTLPEIYEALDVENLTAEQMADDLKSLQNAFDVIVALDIPSVISSKNYVTEEVKKAILDVLTNVKGLNLLSGDRYANLLNAVYNKFVAGKTILNHEFSEGDFAFNDIIFSDEVTSIQSIVEKCYQVLKNLNVTTEDDVLALKDKVANYTSIVDTLATGDNLQQLLNIVNTLVSMKLVSQNSLALYNAFLYPMLQGKVDEAFINVSNYPDVESFTQDLYKLVEIGFDLDALSILDILQNNTIIYEQVDDLRALLDDVVDLNYIHYNLQAILAKYGFDTVIVDNLSLVEDVQFIIEAYKSLVPALNDPLNPYKTINSFKDNKFSWNLVKELVTKYKYNAVYAAEELVLTSIATVVGKPLAVKVINSLTTTNPKLSDLFATLAINDTSDADFKATLIVLAKELRRAVDLGLVEAIDSKDFVLVGLALETLHVDGVYTSNGDYALRSEIVNKLINEVVHTPVINGKLTDLLQNVFTMLDIDVNVADVDLTQINWEEDLPKIYQAITYLSEGLLNIEVETLKDAKETFKFKDAEAVKSYIASLANHKEGVSTLIDAMSQIVSTTLYSQSILPLIYKYVKPSLTKLPTFVNFDSYTTTTISEDSLAIAQSLRAAVGIEGLGFFQDFYKGEQNYAIDFSKEEISFILDKVLTLNFVKDNEKPLLIYALGLAKQYLTSTPEDLSEIIDLQADVPSIINFYKALAVEVLIPSTLDYALQFNSAAAILSNDAALAGFSLALKKLEGTTISKVLIQEGYAFASKTIQPKNALLAGSITSVNYTDADYIQDLDAISDILYQLSKIEFVGILKKTSGGLLDAVANSAILSAVEKLAFVSLNKADLLAGALNLAGCKLVQSYDVEGVDLTTEFTMLKQLNEEFVNLLAENEIVSIKGLVQFFTQNKFKQKRYYTDSNLDKLGSIVITLAGSSILENTGVKVLKHFAAMPQFSGKLSGINNILKLNRYTDESITQDLKVIGTLIKDAASIGVMPFVTNINSEFNATVATDAMNVFFNDMKDSNFLSLYAGELINVFLSAYNIPTTNIDYKTLDWSLEVDSVKNIIVPALVLLNEADVFTIPQLKTFIKSFTGLNANALIKKVAQTLKTVNGENILQAIDGVASSNLADQLSLAVYNRIQPKLVNKLGAFFDLTDYTLEMITQDMNKVATIARNLYNSGIHHSILESAEINDNCVPFIQDVIRDVASLNVLELKLVDLPSFLGKLVPSIDFSTLDLSTVDLQADGEKIADLVQQYVNVVRITDNLKFKLPMLGNTALADNAVAVYDGILPTSIIQSVFPWAYNTFAKKFVNKVASLVKGHSLISTNEDVMGLAEDISTALHSMINMGVFSNSGIDFTKTMEAKNIVNVFFNSIQTASKFKIFVYYIVNRVNYIGIVPFTYEGIDSKTEITAINSLIKSVSSAATTCSALFAGDYGQIANADVQQALTDVVSKAVDSTIVGQLVLPVLSGASKFITHKYYTIDLFENVTNETFVSNILPDVYKFVEYASTLGVFTNNINFADVDTMKKIVSLVVNSSLTKDYCDDLVYFGLEAGLQIDDSVIDLSSVVFTDEETYINNFLTAAQDALTLEGIDFKNLATLKNDAFLSKISDAFPNLNSSKLLKAIIEPVLQKLVAKIPDAQAELRAFIQDRFADSLYDSDAIMEDYGSIEGLLNDISNAGFFTHGMDNFKEFKFDAVQSLIGRVFNLRLVLNHEADFMTSVKGLIPFIKDQTIDFTLVTNWSNEVSSLINTVGSLGKLLKNADFDFNNLTIEMVTKATVKPDLIDAIDKASSSEILAQIIPTLYNDKVAPLVDAQLDGISTVIDFTDPTFTSDKWAAEFDRLLSVGTIVITTPITVQSVIDALKLIFGYTNESDIHISGFYSIQTEAKYKEFFDLITSSSMFTLPDSIIIDSSKVSADGAWSWTKEIDTILAMFKSLGAFEPLTTPLANVDLNSIYESLEFNAINATLNNMNEARSIRSSLVIFIVNAINANSSLGSDMSLAKFESDWFKEQYTVTAGVTSVTTMKSVSEWTPVLSSLARLMSTAFKLDLMNGLDFKTCELGLSYVGDLDSGFTTDNVGLMQALQLINICKLFDIVQLETVLKNYVLTNMGYQTGTMGTATEVQWNEEIVYLTLAIDVLRSNGLFGATNPADILSSLSVASIENILNSINNSVLLRQMLADITYDALVSVGMEDWASDWLKNQLSDSNGTHVGDKAEWTAEIPVLSKLITTATFVGLTSGTINFETIALGQTYAGDIEDNFTTDNIGLKQVFLLINKSKSLKISQLEVVLSDYVSTNMNYKIGTMGLANEASWNDEIDYLINAIDILRTANLFDSTLDPADTLCGLPSSNIQDILYSINESILLRQMLADITYGALVSGGMENWASDWLKNQLSDVNGPHVGTYSEWHGEILNLANLIAATNALGLNNAAIDYKTINLGLSYTGDLEDNFTTTNIGLKQVLSLIVLTSSFKIEQLETELGTYIQTSTGYTISSIAGASDTEWLSEISAIIEVLDDLRHYNLLDGTTVETLNSLTSPQISEVLSSYNNSRLFRSILPSMVNDAIISANMDAWVDPWLTNQIGGTIESKENWAAEMINLATIIDIGSDLALNSLDIATMTDSTITSLNIVLKSVAASKIFKITPLVTLISDHLTIMGVAGVTLHEADVTNWDTEIELLFGTGGLIKDVKNVAFDAFVFTDTTKRGNLATVLNKMDTSQLLSGTVNSMLRAAVANSDYSSLLPDTYLTDTLLDTVTDWDLELNAIGSFNPLGLQTAATFGLMSNSKIMKDMRDTAINAYLVVELFADTGKTLYSFVVITDEMVDAVSSRDWTTEINSITQQGTLMSENTAYRVNDAHDLYDSNHYLMAYVTAAIKTQYGY